MPRYVTRKKICLVIPTLDFGGAEKVFVDLANAFAADGHKVTLLVLSKAGPLLDRVHPVVNLFLLNKKGILHSAPALLFKLRELSPEVIFSTLVHLNIFLGLCRRLGLLFCDTLLLREASIPSIVLKTGLRSRLLARLYRAGYMGADRVIAQSQFMKKDIELLTASDPIRICIIHNPVDLESVERLSVAPINFSHRTRSILFVGQLRLEKQVVHILRALTLPPLTQVTLHIVGDGEQREFLQSQVLNLNLGKRVIFHGTQGNPFPYMKQADLVVLSSAFEGFPNVLIEAIAVGTPVCSYLCPGGVSEIICNDNGLLVEPCTPGALATAIGKLLRSSPTVKQIKGTASRFQKERIVEQYAELF